MTIINMTMAPPTHPRSLEAPRRRWWVRWRWPLALAFIVSCLVVGWYWGERQAQAELDAVLSQWDQHGRWRWKDWLADRPKVPDEENGAVIIDRIHQLIPRRLETDLSFVLFQNDGDDQPHHILHLDQLAELRSRLGKCQQALVLFPEFAQAKLTVVRLPKSDSPLRLPFTTIHNSRQIANLLRDQMQIALHDGQISRAVQSVKQELLLTRIAEHQQTFISRLVQVAIISQACTDIQRILALSEPDDALLLEMQKLLRPFDEQRSWHKTLLTEASILDQTIRDLQDGILDLSGFWIDGASVGTSWWARNYEQVISFFRNRALLSKKQQADCMRDLLKVYEVSSQPWGTQRQSWTRMEREYIKARDEGKHELRFFLLPAIYKLGFTELKMIASLRTTQVALAAERYRRATKRWPAAQQEMLGEYLPSLLTDPFDDQPIRLKAVPDGLVVYSVGKNELDDGGEVLITTEKRVPPDTGFRLWNIPKRRQPALPLSQEYLDRLKELRNALGQVLMEAL